MHKKGDLVTKVNVIRSDQGHEFLSNQLFFFQILHLLHKIPYNAHTILLLYINQLKKTIKMVLCPRHLRFPGINITSNPWWSSGGIDDVADPSQGFEFEGDSILQNNNGRFFDTQADDQFMKKHNWVKDLVPGMYSSLLDNCFDTNPIKIIIICPYNRIDSL